MDAPYSRSRHKRSQYEESGFESGDRQSKRHTSSSYSPLARSSKPSELVFRILCPEAQVGSIIGKGGSIVKSLRQETGARITIQDAVQGSEERVVLISSYDQGDRDRDFSSFSPAQEALFRVHARIFEGGNEEDDQNRNSRTRLAVPNNQVGCLLGKGGKIIEQMREETKAQIRVLPRDQLPLCTLPSDEIVQICGDFNIVKKALILISTRLKINNHPRERERDRERDREWDRERERDRDRDKEREWERGQPSPSVANAYSPDHRQQGDAYSLHGASFSGPGRPDDYVPGIRSSVGASGNRNQAHLLGPRSPGHMHSEIARSRGSEYEDHFPGEELVFRILCPNKKIGSVIGRGGSIIKSLQDDIGVKIKITDLIPGSDERVIIISTIDVLEDNLSTAQEALLHIQSQIVDLGPDKDGVITSRLLVPSNHIGCLIGKGGSVISEMRKETHANIKILSGEDLPPCALELDEMVQIVGDITAAREALVQITSRLRNHVHYENGTPGAFFSIFPDSRNRRRLELSSPDKSHSPFLGFQAGNRSATVKDTWHSKDISSGRTNISDYEERPKQGRHIGSGISSTLAVTTRTTVEVDIPERAIAPLIGNGGKSIDQISQMSGAKVHLLEGRPGSNRYIEISGTPEQAESAQSLLQAFILNGQSSRGSYSG